MAMPAYTPPRYWTEEEFYAARDAAPRGERWELVDGEVLVTPSPHWSHQGVAFTLARCLHDYVSAQALGTVYIAPLDVKLEPRLVLQPDILVVPPGHLRHENDVVTQLLLACEVISPSSARYDRVVKRPRYQRNKVSEYWVVDTRAQLFERWQPDDERPAIVIEQLVWHPTGATLPFELDVPALFRDASPL